MLARRTRVRLFGCAKQTLYMVLGCIDRNMQTPDRYRQAVGGAHGQPMWKDDKTVQILTHCGDLRMSRRAVKEVCAQGDEASGGGLHSKWIRSVGMHNAALKQTQPGYRGTGKNEERGSRRSDNLWAKSAAIITDTAAWIEIQWGCMNARVILWARYVSHW